MMTRRTASGRERRIRLWPRGLIGRVMLVLLASIILVSMASWVLYEHTEAYLQDDDRLDLIGERLATDVRMINGAPPSTRPMIVSLLSSADLAMTWLPAGAPPDPSAESAHLTQIHERLVTANPLLAHMNLRLHRGRVGKRSDITGSIVLADHSQIRFRAPDLLRSHIVTRGLMTAAIVTLGVLVVAAMLVHALTLPLRALVTVADTVGSETWEPLAEKGPGEVRRLAQAINAMQKRITQLIEDRTEALAAVSHDLRTPLARLRLRAGFINDPEAQEAIEADIDEMEAMVDGVLAYLSGEKKREQSRPVDLAAILTTLADEAHDRGAQVIYDGPPRLSVRLPPLSMKRVFNNLVENALYYAGAATIRLHQENGTVIVDVDDEGPGIPPEELSRVIVAFYRVEASRSRRTGGLGLGLAIVQREVARAGGSFLLENRAPHGLRARVILPSSG